jgi:hypothetical protein
MGIEMAYPNELVRQPLAARDEVLRLGGEGAFPFDYETQTDDAGFWP